MMITKKNIVFRVIDFSTSRSNDEFNTTLKIVINNNLLKEKLSKLHINAIIVSFCYKNEQKKVALMKFHDEMFAYLLKLTINSLKNWQIEWNDTKINFNCHFFEFIQFYSSKRDALIVAKHVTFLWICNQCS